MTTPPEQPPTPDEGAATPPPLPPAPPAQPGWQAPPPGGPAPGWGQPPAYGQMPFQPAPPTEGLAVAAMVIGIVGLVGACMYGLGTIISPVALFLGWSSMKKIDASQGQLGGRGMAQAGFIMGIIGTVILVLTIIAIGTFMAFVVGGTFESDYSDFPEPIPSMEPGY